MCIKLPFGMKNSKLIHISEITEEEKGLNCGCVCPKCGHPLIAKLGIKKTSHFAHLNPDCRNAFETALHIYAKEILKKSMKINLPELAFRNYVQYETKEDFKKSFLAMGKSQYEVITVVEEGYCLNFDSIEIEKKLGEIIADIVIYKKGVPLIIEIAVTHFADEKKEEKIRNMGISAIEVNLAINYIDYYNFDRNLVERIIVEETSSKYWLFNRREEIEKENALKRNGRLLKELKEQEDAVRRANEYVQKKKQENIRAKLIKIEEIVDNKEARIKEYAINFPKEKLWLQISNRLDIKLTDIPEFLNVIVDEELVFNCDRRVWQSYIFEKFILNKHNEIHKVKFIKDYILNHSTLPINKLFQHIRGLKITRDSKDRKIPDLVGAISSYLLALEDRGFLRAVSYPNDYNAKFKIIHDKLSIPNKKTFRLWD